MINIVKMIRMIKSRRTDIQPSPIPNDDGQLDKDGKAGKEGKEEKAGKEGKYVFFVSVRFFEGFKNITNFILESHMPHFLL